MQSMPEPFTVEQIVPLVDALTPEERVRLLHLIARSRKQEAPVYAAVPPTADEFSTDEEPLAWEGEGWENVS